mmetsp:Transcript_29070/g.40907  ORF Transcript_29070/g.40907 Transcript_29070/m.40907 type:complete len:166 (+) Transcript_29070:575-1072(+)
MSNLLAKTKDTATTLWRTVRINTRSNPTNNMSNLTPATAEPTIISDRMWSTITMSIQGIVETTGISQGRTMKNINQGSVTIITNQGSTMAIIRSITMITSSTMKNTSQGTTIITSQSSTMTIISQGATIIIRSVTMKNISQGTMIITSQGSTMTTSSEGTTGHTQ